MASPCPGEWWLICRKVTKKMKQPFTVISPLTVHEAIDLKKSIKLISTALISINNPITEPEVIRNCKTKSLISN